MADRFAERHITGCATEDLKVGRFSYAEAGQMHLYLNYARASNCSPNSDNVFSPLIAANATFALKVAVWFFSRTL
jgi:hypothetical protein